MRHIVSLLFCWAFRWLDGKDAQLIITEKAAAADDLGYEQVVAMLASGGLWTAADQEILEGKRLP